MSIRRFALAALASALVITGVAGPVAAAQTMICWSPQMTIARFSSVNETISAIVPIETKSSNSQGISSSNAHATLKATPTPARSLKGYAPFG